jgi:hypothetical protein
LVGLSQWRAREGALFSSCLYRHWDPDPLAALLGVGGGGPDELADGLRTVAVGVDDIGPVSAVDLGALADSLLRSFDQLG